MWCRFLNGITVPLASDVRDVRLLAERGPVVKHDGFNKRPLTISVQYYDLQCVVYWFSKSVEEDFGAAVGEYIIRYMGQLLHVFGNNFSKGILPKELIIKV